MRSDELACSVLIRGEPIPGAAEVLTELGEGVTKVDRILDSVCTPGGYGGLPQVTVGWKDPCRHFADKPV
jgi:hypothetical protein